MRNTSAKIKYIVIRESALDANTIPIQEARDLSKLIDEHPDLEDWPSRPASGSQSPVLSLELTSKANEANEALTKPSKLPNYPRPLGCLRSQNYPYQYAQPFPA